MQMRGEFSVADWQQSEVPGLPQTQPMMHVSAVFDVNGDIMGRFMVEYLMYYRYFDEDDQHDSIARYTGYLVFEGQLEGREGSFVAHDVGVYADMQPASTLTIIEGSGTGIFTGIAGAGKYYATEGKMLLELDYTL